MRSTSLVDRFTLKFGGSVMQNALCIGDLDNDGDSEIVVGNNEGDLAVFKDGFRDPWKRCSGLGQISAIGIGDLYNRGFNVLVVLTADGWCYVFDFTKTEEDFERREAEARAAAEEAERLSREERQAREAESRLHEDEQLALDKEVAAAVEGDKVSVSSQTSGMANLLLSVPKKTTSSNSSSPAQLASPVPSHRTTTSSVSPKRSSSGNASPAPSVTSKASSSSGDHALINAAAAGEATSEVASKPTGDDGSLQTVSEESESVRPQEGSATSENQDGGSSGEDEEEEEEDEDGGDSEPHRRCKFRAWFRQRLPPNVKEAMLFDVNNDGLTELVLALTDRVVRAYQWQSGGEEDSRYATDTLISLYKWEFASQVGSITRHRNKDGTNALIVAQPGAALLKLNCGGDVAHEPLNVGKMRNFNVSGEINGGLETALREEGQSSPYAIATLDGNLLLVQDEKILWNLQTHQQLFCVRKFDLNGDGNDEIVVSAWNGKTFVVTQSRHVMSFHFEEMTSTFTCGHLTVDGETVPVMAYVTFNQRIVVFYNIKLKVGPIRTGLDSEGSLTEALLREAGIAVKDEKEMAELNRFLLYRRPRKTGAPREEEPTTPTLASSLEAAP